MITSPCRLTAPYNRDAGLAISAIVAWPLGTDPVTRSAPNLRGGLGTRTTRISTEIGGSGSREAQPIYPTQCKQLFQDRLTFAPSLAPRAASAWRRYRAVRTPSRDRRECFLPRGARLTAKIAPLSARLVTHFSTANRSGPMTSYQRPHHIFQNLVAT